MIWFYRDCEIEWQLKIKSKQGRLCAHNKKETLLIAKHTHSAIGKPTRLKQMKEIRLQHPAALGKWKAGCMLWSQRQIKRAGLNTLPEALQEEVFQWELSWEDGVEATFQQVQVYLWVKKKEINHYIKRSGDAKLRCESEKAQQLVKAGGTTSERITQRKSTKKNNCKQNYGNHTYWRRNILFAVLISFVRMFFTWFIIITKQRTPFLGHLDKTSPAERRPAVITTVVCAHCLHPSCSIKMADVEDDEKFLYGGKDRLENIPS